MDQRLRPNERPFDWTDADVQIAETQYRVRFVLC